MTTYSLTLTADELETVAAALIRRRQGETRDEYLDRIAAILDKIDTCPCDGPDLLLARNA